MLDDLKFIQTPFCAGLKFRAYTFAWFHDSNLAMYIANELLAVGLISECVLYHSGAFGGFDPCCLSDDLEWQQFNIRNQEFYLRYHRSIKASERKMIGRVISESINKFKQNESMYYKTV